MTFLTAHLTYPRRWLPYDVLAPMRFLPLYNLGLDYCSHCGGPMNHPWMLESGHYDCFTIAVTEGFSRIAAATALTCSAFSDLSKAVAAVTWSALTLPMPKAVSA
jgi:hypothetical protein